MVSFSSCSSDEEESLKVLNNSEEQFDDAISQEAISFVSSLNGNDTRSASCVTVSKIQQMNLDFEDLTRSAADIPSFYSVSMDDHNGTVIIAAKNNTIKPLAYFQGENDVDINKVLDDTVSAFAFIVQMLVEQNLEMEDDSSATTRSVTNTIVERLEPKCKVWWGQKDPYNKYCFTTDGRSAYTGCVATAGAQALTVLRPNEPLISSWDAVIAEIPEYNPNSTVTDEIAKLIHEIGVNVHMKYGAVEEKKGSSASKSELIEYFHNKYGVEDYDYKRAIDVLKTEHGVIIVGGYATKKTSGWWLWEKNHYDNGHAYIADGYVKYGNEGTTQNSDPYYLHLNYGWGSSFANNAYVLSGNKKFIDNAGDYFNGKLYKYKISYATLTYPSEKNW